MAVYHNKHNKKCVFNTSSLLSGRISTLKDETGAVKFILSHMLIIITHDASKTLWTVCFNVAQYLSFLDIR